MKNSGVAVLLTCLALAHGAPEAWSADGADLPPTMRSQQRAQAILKEGITALGGIERIKSLESVRMEYSGLRHMINQSRRAGPPWDREPSTGTILIDRKNERLYSLSSNSYPGIGAFAASWAVTGREGFHLDALRNHHGTEIMKMSADDADWAWAYNTRLVPPLLLLQASENNTSLRWIDSYKKDGRIFEAISFVQPNGAAPVLIFDANTHLLEGFETVRADGVYGDVTDFVRFGEYREFAGVRLPTVRTDYLNGEIARELSLTISVNAAVDGKLFEVPEGYVPAKEGMDADYTRIRRIGDGVYLDQDMGGVMIVEFSDFLLVLDCPGDFFMSQSTIDAAQAAIPGKPIRYVVSSHTHGDHCGGARAYFHAGATLVTTPGHAEFYRELARVRQTINPDPLTATPKPPVIETFTGKKVISDDGQTVVLYDVGPNAHSEELVVAWLPRQKILWQADLFFIPYTGGDVNVALPVTIEFARKLESLGISDLEQLIDAHHSRVATREEFRESLRKAGDQGH